MSRAFKGALPAIAVALAGCASDTPDLGVRAIADPLSNASRPGNSMLSEARAMLGLGNVGLAIEAYRRALRQQPGSVEAYAGLAECYGRMGRHDLARTNYEAALAIAPGNAILLRTFAASLDRQGRRREADALRVEAAQADAADSGVLADSAVQSLLPERAAPAAAMDTATAESPPAALPQASNTLPVAPRVGSITVKLPELQAPASAEHKPPAATLAENDAPTPKMDARGPRLERLSLAEVALVTTAQPRWRAEIVRRTASSTTVRFVPLAELRRSATVRLLNAARRQGLAARTRVALNRKGWDRVTIGDAGRVREKSLILYSPATMSAARRLASEFGMAIARDPRPGPLTILLGRDAVKAPVRA